jgi:hypothetical protein
MWLSTATVSRCSEQLEQWSLPCTSRWTCWSQLRHSKELCSTALRIFSVLWISAHIFNTSFAQDKLTDYQSSVVCGSLPLKASSRLIPSLYRAQHHGYLIATANWKWKASFQSLPHLGRGLKITKWRTRGWKPSENSPQPLMLLVLPFSENMSNTKILLSIVNCNIKKNQKQGGKLTHELLCCVGIRESNLTNLSQKIAFRVSQVYCNVIHLINLFCYLLWLFCITTNIFYVMRLYCMGFDWSVGRLLKDIQDSRKIYRVRDIHSNTWPKGLNR